VHQSYNNKQVITLHEWVSNASEHSIVPRPPPFRLGFYTHASLFGIEDKTINRTNY